MSDSGPPQEASTLDLSDRDYQLIEDTAAFARYLAILADCPVVAVDTESNSLFRYRERVSLIQLTGRTAEGALHHAIVDPMADVDISGLGPIMADPQVTVIFHGADFDVVSLKRDYGFNFTNVYDTMIAARAAGMQRFGLADLVREYFQVELNKKFQKHDWSARPLIQEALDYAHLDTRYLPEIMDSLRERVGLVDRQDVVDEECALVSLREWTPPAGGDDLYINMKGASKLDPDAQRVLRALFELRDQIAEKQDRPPFKVLGGDLMLALATRAPTDQAALEEVSGRRHRQVKRYAQEILAAVAKGQADDRPLPRPGKKNQRDGGPRKDGHRYSKEDDLLFTRLRNWRNAQAEKEALEPAMVLNNQALKEVAMMRPTDAGQLAAVNGLREWQKRRYADALVAQVVAFSESAGAEDAPA